MTNLSAYWDGIAIGSTDPYHREILAPIPDGLRDVSHLRLSNSMEVLKVQQNVDINQMNLNWKTMNLQRTKIDLIGPK